MSFVSIWKPVNDRIVQAARDTDTEIIGLLLGRLQANTIVIEDSTTGDFSSERHGVTLPGSSLAIIADRLVSGRLKGSIVGWYHSHTEGGLFFSDIDIETQKKLQQFSSLITGMVVDSATGEVGYFRVAPGTTKAIRVPDANVKIYSDPKDAAPSRPEPAPILAPTPTVEVRRYPPSERLVTRRTALSIILVTLIILAGIFAALVYVGLPHERAVMISHRPVQEAIIGTPIQIIANVTGSPRNVTLVYGVATGNLSNALAMNPIVGGEYGGVIPSDQVTGDIAYYVTATDVSGNRINTATYHIAVGDFMLQPQSASLTVYKSRYAISGVQLQSINGFNQQLKLSTSGSPAGLAVTFSPNPAPAGSTVNLNVTAGPTAQNGTYAIVVAATYLPTQSPPVIRQTSLVVTVADFDLQVEPSSNVVHAGQTTTFSLNLTLQRGFVDPVKVNLVGLPQGATYSLEITNPTVLAVGPGTTAMKLLITIPPSTKPGTYPVEVEAVGGNITHSLTIQLIVR